MDKIKARDLFFGVNIFKGECLPNKGKAQMSVIETHDLLDYWKKKNNIQDEEIEINRSNPGYSRYVIQEWVPEIDRMIKMYHGAMKQIMPIK